MKDLLAVACVLALITVAKSSTPLDKGYSKLYDKTSHVAKTHTSVAESVVSDEYIVNNSGDEQQHLHSQQIPSKSNLPTTYTPEFAETAYTASDNNYAENDTVDYREDIIRGFLLGSMYPFTTGSAPRRTDPVSSIVNHMTSYTSSIPSTMPLPNLMGIMPPISNMPFPKPNKQKRSSYNYSNGGLNYMTPNTNGISIVF